MSNFHDLKLLGKTKAISLKKNVCFLSLQLPESWCYFYAIEDIVRREDDGAIIGVHHPRNSILQKMKAKNKSLVGNKLLSKTYS